MWKRLRERRGRLILFAVGSMAVAAVFGGGAFLSTFIRVAPRPDAFSQGLRSGTNTAAVIFWVLFSIEFLIEMTKSHAVLEFERIVKRGEEIYSRGRATR
jgi:hypothetical protein